MCRKFEVAPNEERSEENCEFEVDFNCREIMCCLWLSNC